MPRNTASTCALARVPNPEPIVRPEVPQHADILCLGFAPGRDEVPVGRPFVGASGRLLRGWLSSTGLAERSAFANVELHRTYDLVCRTCGIEYWADRKLQDLVTKDLTHLAGEGKPLTKTEAKYVQKYAQSGALECSFAEHQWRETKGNREPNPKTEECGLPIIEKLLASREWKCVICWGAVPARAVGGYKGPVGSMVGRFRTLSQYGDVLATVLYHPAYALRKKGSAEFATIESGTKEILRQINDRLEHPAGKDRYPYVELTEGMVPRLATGTVVDIETETAGKTPDPRLDRPTQLCVGWLDAPDVVLRSLAPGDRLTIEPSSRLVMHNAQYDLPLLMRLSGSEDFTADDTMVMAYLLGHESLSLKILARRLLGKHAREYLEKSGPDDREYDAQDPHLTRDLYHLFRPQIDAKGLGFLYDEVKTPLQRIMARGVMRGLKVDQERLRNLDAKMEARAATLQARLFAIAGYEFNPASPPQVSRIIFYERGIPPMEVRKGRSVEYVRTTSETYIGEFRADPFVATLLAYRRATGFRSRYTVPLQLAPRVSGLYDCTGTGTDRISQANRNCMNFPMLVKECIEADEGGYFVYGDFSQIELRLSAYFSQDPYLLAVLREGRNMHAELCAAVYGARTPETYTQAKSSNFARLYGAGLKRQARTLKMPVAVVERNRIEWPGWDAWVESRNREPARTYWGYERNIDDAIESADEYVRGKALRQVINSIIQGTAGEINQYAQVLCDQVVSQLGGYVIHQEHDSVLGWVPNSIRQEESIDAMASAMKAAVPQEILDVIEIKVNVVVGTHWH